MKRNLMFGVEMEVATSKSCYQIKEALEEAGINAVVTRYGAPTNYEAWKIHHDGSLGRGWEIVSPPSTSTEELEKVCHILRHVLKVKCTFKCGLHVHHDISDLNLEQIKNLYRIYDKYESNAIRSIMSPNRLNNTYCNEIHSSMPAIESASTIDEFKRAMYSRYHSLNNKSYVKYGTIEFRRAQGTVEIDRILSWIDLTHKMIEKACDLEEVKPLQATNDEEALNEMLTELQVNEMTAKHYHKVQKFFKKVASR